MNAIRSIKPLHLAWLIFAVSLSALIAAWGFELIGGYKPCPLCLQERYAYYLALPLSLLAALLIQSPNAKGPYAQWANFVLLLIALAYLINTGLGSYHAGVEWHWWPGPSSCSGDVSATVLSADNLLERLKETRVVRCDQAPFRFLGLSFAGYNALLSLDLALAALLALFLNKTPQ